MSESEHQNSRMSISVPNLIKPLDGPFSFTKRFENASNFSYNLQNRTFRALPSEANMVHPFLKSEKLPPRHTETIPEKKKISKSMIGDSVNFESSRKLLGKPNNNVIQSHTNHAPLFRSKIVGSKVLQTSAKISASNGKNCLVQDIETKSKHATLDIDTIAELLRQTLELKPIHGNPISSISVGNKKLRSRANPKILNQFSDQFKANASMKGQFQFPEAKEHLNDVTLQQVPNFFPSAQPPLYHVAPAAESSLTPVQPTPKSKFNPVFLPRPSSSSPSSPSKTRPQDPSALSSPSLKRTSMHQNAATDTAVFNTNNNTPSIPLMSSQSSFSTFQQQGSSIESGGAPSNGFHTPRSKGGRANTFGLNDLDGFISRRASEISEFSSADSSSNNNIAGSPLRFETLIDRGKGHVSDGSRVVGSQGQMFDGSGLDVNSGNSLSRSEVWPILVAFIPCVFSVMFGINAFGEVLILLGLMFYLFYVIRVPWDLFINTKSKNWYTINAEKKPDANKDENDKIEPTQSSQRAEFELSCWEAIFMLMVVISPVLGATGLYLVKQNLVVFKQVITSHSIILFFLAASVRPLKMLIAMIQGHTETLVNQLTIHPSQIDNMNRKLHDLQRELDHQREVICNNAFEKDGSIGGTASATTVDSIGQLARSIRRFEKREDRLQMVVEARLAAIENRLWKMSNVDACLDAGYLQFANDDQT
ncbi:hypothetical protein HK096_004112, partial [Nowakowskiella sp. JEL0078]